MMKKPDGQNRGARATGDQEIHLEGLLGPLGEALGRLLESAAKSGTAETTHEKTFETAQGPLQARAGLRLRMGGLDVTGTTGTRDTARPVNTRRSTAAPKQGTPTGAAVRTPDVEVFSDGGSWMLVAEMPGVDREDLDLSLAGTRLVVETRGTRRYRFETDFPQGARLEDLETTLRNGVLELSLKRGQT